MGKDLVFLQDIIKKPDAGKWLFNTDKMVWEEKSFTNKIEDIFICGYVRSGSNFLIDLLHLAYKLPIQECCHTTSAIDNSVKSFVPFRNPENCVPSWSHMTNQKIDDCAEFYLRFNKHALKNKNKIIFLDFNIFTKDIEYFFNKVESSTGIKNFNVIYSDVVFNHEKRREKILDKKPYEREAVAFKESIFYDECIEIYKELKKVHDEEQK